MDNDECIIFEKGLKPIKAKKYWWFKESHIVRDLEGNEISHNDYVVENRGEWRKFNPYNPYVEPSSDSEREETKIGSLDDLFEETPSNTNKAQEENISHVNNINLNNVNNVNNGNMNYTNQFNQNNVINPVNQNNFKDENRYNQDPVSKVEAMNQRTSQETQEEDIDIQKELEAKFDELFGKM